MVLTSEYLGTMLLGLLRLQTLLSTESLQRFLAASPVLDNAKTLSFEARNIIEGYVLGVHPANFTASRALRDGEAPETIFTANNRFQRRARDIRNSLSALATHLPNMLKLRAFRLEIVMNSPKSTSEELAYNQTLRTLLLSLPKSITTLMIDICCEPPYTYHEDADLSLNANTDADNVHSVCHVLSVEGCLPYLRHIRLRAHTICPKVIKMVPHNTHPRLETVVLNLNHHDNASKGGHIMPYCPEYGIPKGPLYFEMLNMAEAAILNFPALKTCRILKPKFPNLQVTSYDVVSKR